jgi:hypothetical protein
MGRIKSLPSGSVFAGRGRFLQARSIGGLQVRPRKEEEEDFGIKDILQILQLGEAIVNDQGFIGLTTHAISRAQRESKLDGAKRMAADARALAAQRQKTEGDLSSGAVILPGAIPATQGDRPSSKEYADTPGGARREAAGMMPVEMAERLNKAYSLGIATGDTPPPQPGQAQPGEAAGTALGEALQTLPTTVASAADVEADAAEQNGKYIAEYRRVLDQGVAEQAQRRATLKKIGASTERDLMSAMQHVRSGEDFMQVLALVPGIIDTDPNYAPRTLGEAMGYNRAGKANAVMGNLFNAFKFINRPDADTERKLSRVMDMAKLEDISLRREARAARDRVRAEKSAKQVEAIDARLKKQAARKRSGKFGKSQITPEDMASYHTGMRAENPTYPPSDVVAGWNKASHSWYVKTLKEVRDERALTTKSAGAAAAALAGKQDLAGRQAQWDAADGTRKTRLKQVSGSLTGLRRNVETARKTVKGIEAAGPAWSGYKNLGKERRVLKAAEAALKKAKEEQEELSKVTVRPTQ